MKVRLLMLVSVALSACGGSWSNRDLEFVSALPSRAELRSKLPTSGSTTSPLTGVATQRDPLNVGDPSKAYADAKNAAVTFNGILDFLLGVLDQVRAVPPTSRTSDSRTWGPYPDRKNPGLEFRVTIRQVDQDTFAWSMQATKLATGTTLDIVTGAFKATATAKKGRGTMNVPVQGFRDELAVDANFKQLDEIVIGYVTDQYPIQVAMAFTLKPGAASGISTIGYTYLEREDRSGALNYEIRSTSTDTTVLETTSVWNAQGAGRAHSKVKEGKYTGATLDECWDTAFTVLYYAEGWTGGMTNGRAENCPVIPGL